MIAGRLLTSSLLLFIGILNAFAQIELTLEPSPETTTPPAIVLEIPTDETFYFGGPDSADNTTWGRIPAGVYFRVSQKGIDYITSLAAEALPKLLEGSVLPTVEQPQIKIEKLTIEKFGDPQIKAKFVADSGIAANISLPQVMISAVYDASTFFTTYKGKFRADVQNLSIVMEVSIDRDEETKTNIIETPICNISADKVRVAFVGDMSTYLNLMRSLIEQTVIDVVGNELCRISIQIAQFFEQQKREILTTTPVPPPTTPQPTLTLRYADNFIPPYRRPATTSTPVSNEDEIYETSEEDKEDKDTDAAAAARFAAELCADEGDDSLFAKLGKTASQGSIGDDQSSERFNPLLTEGLWAPDLTLMYPPKFTKDDVVFGLDGGIVFYGKRAENVPRPAHLNISALGGKMVGFLISDYVPNTFFNHIYKNQLGTIKETFSVRNLPRFVKPIARILCSTCELKLVANLTDQPHMTINKDGVRLEIEGDVQIAFEGRRRDFKIVKANAKLEVTVRPYLQYSRVYGDVALTSVDVKLKDMGVRGMFANSFRKALNAIIPRRLWPKIKKRLRFALNQRGFKLPVMCGVVLEHPSMTYVNHGIVINTDFSFNVTSFVQKFKKHVRSEMERAKKKHSFNSNEEYDGFRYI
ncbi:hypothetical protein AB6A40_002594 [Gnathostoma spinigerum]|uniref:Uncharacterized protein n=1 Tax=Gnathostoma spinigerum TaxID=75299 RepID=A0ABD6EHU6_9BILA